MKGTEPKLLGIFLVLLFSLAFYSYGKSSYSSPFLKIESAHSLNGLGSSSAPPKFKLHFSKNFSGDGPHSKEADTYSIEPGKKVVLEAEANDGYFFSHWTVNDVKVSEELEYEFVMPERNVIIIGHFTEIKEPSIKIVSPVANARFVEGENVLVTVEAESQNGPIDRIELFRNNNLVGSVSGNPESISFTLSNLAADTYVLTARVFDRKGGRSVSSPVRIHVDKPNQLPVVEIISPKNGDLYLEGSPIEVEAEANDPDGKIERVEFYVGSRLVGTETSAPYKALIVGLDPGNYHLTAKAFDNMGASAISAPIQIRVERKNLPPEIRITSPKEGDEFFVGDEITVRAEALDRDGTVNRVEFFINGILFKSVTSKPYQVNITDLKAGDYTINAKAYDNAGAATVSNGVQIRVIDEIIPPEIRINSPKEGQEFFVGEAIRIEAEIIEGKETVKKVEFYYGETLIGISLASPFHVTWNNAPEGSHYLQAKAFDEKDKVGESEQVLITVRDIVVLPDVELITPFENQVFQEGESVYFTVMFSGDAGSVSKVTYYNGNEILGTSLEDPFDFELENAKAGIYQVKAVAEGGDPPSEKTSSTIQFTVENKPEIPFTIIEPLRNARFQQGDVIAIQVAVPESKKKILRVEFYRGNVLLGTSIEPPYSFKWQNTLSGDFNLVARLLYDDGSSLISQVVRITVVQKFDPKMILNYDINQNAENPAFHQVQLEVEFEYLKAAIRHVGYFVNGVFLGKNEENPYSYLWDYVLPGTYRVKAVAMDASGKTLESEEVIVQIDEGEEDDISPSVEVNYVIGPNPTGGFLNLIFETSESGWDLEVDIIGMSGTQLDNFKTVMIRNEVTLDLRHLVPGNYLLYLKGTQKRFEVKRFVKR